MNWIKQNPFLSTLLGSTLVLCGLLAFIAIKGGSKYQQAKVDFEKAHGDVTKSEKLPLYPTKDNSQAKQKALDDYLQSIDELSGFYSKFQLDPTKQITTQQFTENVKAANAEVIKAFGADAAQSEARTKLPADFFMGFEAYKGQLAKTGATAFLDYQLNAIKHVLLGMAEARPSELISIYREKIPEESDAKFELPKHGVARKFGYEIVFKGSEASVRDFLNKLGEKKSYYCVIRSIRINNERDTPPRISDAKFERPQEAAPAGNPFGAAFFEEAPAPAPAPAVPPQPEGTPAVVPQPEAVVPPAGVAPPTAEGGAAAPAPFAAPEPSAKASTDSSRILYQVLGDEELQVFVRFDVLLFLPKAAPAKP
jgi:hypothetical protein